MLASMQLHIMTEVITKDFTCTGFRFVEISGISLTAMVGCLKARVYSRNDYMLTCFPSI